MDNDESIESKEETKQTIKGQKKSHKILIKLSMFDLKVENN